ncbi:MAG: succinylglutamate desuccinylase/aspartoacylase family protein [Candidatus Nealsonbacteria bacterium]|nr:succinylglutamate desuccinylase/aspartoacylase family protein [Candidatus Nealsonbacteria bacterium]
MTLRDLKIMRALHSLPLQILLLTLLASTARAELTHTNGLIAENTEWQNPYYIIDSGVEGPTLLVTGGLHGNEPAGYRAAEQIRHWPIRRGKLIVVPRVNTPGLRQNTRWLPGLPDATRNANRNFPTGDEPGEARSVPIEALWEFIRQQRPDWVVDMHEGFDFHVANPKSDGSSIIYFDTPEMQRLAANIHDDVNATIDDPDRKLVKRSKSGPIEGGLVRAVVQQLGAKGFCFETTYQKQPLSIRTRQHRIMVHRLMRELEMIDGSGVNVMTSADETAQTRVAIYDAGGTGGSGVEKLARILEQDPKSTPRFVLHHVGPPEIRAGVLDQFDVVIFPGGSGSKEAAALGEAGCKAVREFVHAGGGYVGICAGAFLATAKYDWSLALLSAKTFTGKRHIPGVGEQSMWFRGSGTVKMELTEAGKAILGDVQGPIEIRYANGPIVSPFAVDGLPPYVPLAIFRTEISKYKPQQGTMINTPAIIAAPFGKGRAMAVSPHPEGVEGLESLVRRAVLWVAGQSL